MARRKKKRTLRPRLPARVKKKRKGTTKKRGQQHHELSGLGLIGLGLFLATILYLGWNGGKVGGGADPAARTRDPAPQARASRRRRARIPGRGRRDAPAATPPGRARPR